MTSVSVVYRLALAQIFETPGGDADFDSFAPLVLNTLLCEALPYENAIRRAAGREELRELPEIEQITDARIDMDDRITRAALPYGLASVLLADDEARKAESVMKRNQFIAALEDAAPVALEPVRGWEGEAE